MLLLNMKSPCLGCENRCIGCHSKCSSYNQYKSNLELYKIIKTQSEKIYSNYLPGRLRRYYG